MTVHLFLPRYIHVLNKFSVLNCLNVTKPVTWNKRDIQNKSDSILIRAHNHLAILPKWLSGLSSN